MRKLLLMIFSIIGVFEFTNAADITTEQFARTQKMLRNICQSRFGVTDEQIDMINRDSDLFDDNTQEKCYATCILEMLNLVINGQIPTALAYQSIDLLLPNELKDPTTQSLEDCRTFLPDHPSNVHCIVGHSMFKCLTDKNLKFFFI